MPPWERYQHAEPPSAAARPPAPWERYQGKKTPEREPLATVGATLEHIPYGVNEHLASMARGLDTLTGGGRPEGAPPSLMGRAAEALGGERMVGDAPENAAERVARSAGRTLGETVGPAGAALGVGRMATRPLTSLGERIAVGMSGAQTPATAAGTEVAAGLGAGAGGQIAEEMGGPRVVGEVLGGLSPAGIAAWPTTRKMAVKGAKLLARPLFKSEQAREAREEVQKMLGGHLESPDVKESLSRAEQLRKEIPGFEPTLGEATGQQALITEQRALERAATGEDLSELAQRRASSEASVEAFSEGAQPRSPLDVQEAVGRVAARPKAVQEKIAKALADVEQKRQELAGPVRYADRAGLGERMRERVSAVRGEVADRMGKLADELGIADADVTVPFQGFVSRVQAMQRDLLPSQRAHMPDAMQDVRALAARGKRAPVRFKDVKALREGVTEEILETVRSTEPGHRKRLANLLNLRSMIDEDLLGRGLDEAQPGLSDAYAAFRKAYFDEFIAPFEQGAAFQVRRKDGTGFYRTLDEDVAAKFIASRDAAEQYTRLFGDDPEALADLRTALLDDLANTAVRDGKLDPRLYQTWMRRKRDVLAGVPSLGREAADMGAMNERLLARQASLNRRQKAVEDSVLSRRLRSLAQDRTTPEGMIDNALKNPRLMERIVKRVRGDKDALQAIRRHVWDNLTSLEPDAMLAYMNDRLPALQKVFDDDHLRNLAAIHDARAMLARTPRPEGSAGMGDVFQSFEKNVGIKPQALASRYANIKALRLSGEYVFMELLGRIMRQHKQKTRTNLLREALYSPEIAQDLAYTANGKFQPEEASRRINAWVFTLGLDETEDEQAGPGAQPSPEATAEQSTAQGAPSVLSTRDEFDALPSGARFIAKDDPTQTVRVKP